MFRPFFQNIRKGFWVSASRSAFNYLSKSLFWVSASRGLALRSVEFDEEMNMATTAPDDVEEGYFTVLAVQGGETQRFVVKLDNLRNPAFLSLLEQAREEYHFSRRELSLSPTCRPEELQQIPQYQNQENTATESWPARDATTIIGGY